MHGLDVVAVEVPEEHSVVPRVVLRPFPRGVQHPRAGRHGRGMHGVYRLPVRSSKGEVDLASLWSGCRAQPEAGYPVGAGQTHHKGSVDGDAHGLPDAERLEHLQIELQ